MDIFAKENNEKSESEDDIETVFISMDIFWVGFISMDIFDYSIMLTGLQRCFCDISESNISNWVNVRETAFIHLQ